MTKITFILPDDAEQIVNAKNGLSLQDVAFIEDIIDLPGICGGEMACGTCHVYVENGWYDKLEEAKSYEDDLIDMLAVEPKDNSRLGCQVIVTDESDGLVVRIAPNDYNM